MSRLLASCCLIAVSLPAQTPPCFAVNGTSANAGTTLTPNLPGGPNVFAWRLILGTPSGSALRAMSIFTGNTAAQPGFMKLEIWRDGPNGLPLSRWAGGSWQISHALGNCWQGADTDLDIANWPLPLWVVWTEPGSSTEPFEPGGATLPTAQLINGTWTLLPAQTAPKLRFFCTRLDDAHVTVPWFSAGGGCWATGANGWGTLFTNRQPAVGNADFAFEGSGFLPGQLAFLVLGTTWGGLPPPIGCSLQPDRQAVLWGATGTGDVRASALTGAAGHVTFPLPIPANSFLAGMSIFGQLVVMDPASTPQPFAVSNDLQILVY